jgi:hypothetical protein
MKRRRGNQPGGGTFAEFAFLERLVGKLLNDFKTFPALPAFILVEGHDFPSAGEETPWPGSSHYMDGEKEASS